MADITDPIPSLPGSLHCAPMDAKCDNHPDRPAIARIQGETDSFGSEMHDLCEECVGAERKYNRSAEARSGLCDWCKRNATDLAHTRDYDEGLTGPVYRVCAACRKRRNEEYSSDHTVDDWD